jgi:hypothetical protein
MSNRLILKLLVILIGCLLLSLVVLRNEIRPTVSHRMPLEVSWISALAATLGHDLVSGRDYYYTYGVISQAIAYLAFILSGKQNAVLSYVEIINSFRILNILLLGVMLVLLSKNALYALLFLIYISVTNIFTSNAPLAVVFVFRGLILLLQAFMASKVLSLDNISLRRLGAFVFGLNALIAQLLTAELGLYSVFLFVLSSFILFLTGFNFKFENIKNTIEPNVIMLTSYFISNTFLSIVFKLTSHYSIGLFDYQFYTMQLTLGYASTMGMAWAADFRTTLVLLSVTALVAIFLVITSRGKELRERSLPICLFLAALIYTRQATLRSDMGHILAGFTPMMLVFLLSVNWLNKLYLRVVWLIGIILLVLTLPLSGLYVYEDLINLTSSSKPYTKSDINSIIYNKTNALYYIDQHLDNKSVLNFPSENYISIVLNKEIVAPVLLAHNAHTSLLQERYAKMLEEKRDNMSVTYSLDNIATGAIDKVQHVSRIPVIFEYLWQNYKLKVDQPFDDGIYILQLRSTPSHLRPNSVLQFSVREEGRQIVIDPQQTVQCPLVKIEMRVTYPLYALLGRPNGIWAKFFDGNQLVHESGLVAIETNKSFYTYISLLDDKEFYTLFSDNPSSPKRWNRMVLSYRDTGFMGVNPSDLQIAKLYCVLGQNND